MYKNIVWDLLGKFGTQIVSFLLSIVLTRLLTPAEYGIMGMVMVIVTFAHIFLDLGFNRAIIQRPEVSQTQYSTIFYINTGMALLLSLACFCSAAAVARFYGQPIIEPIFKVVSLSFLLNGLNLIPSSILYKKMRFKVNSIQSLIAAVVSGIIGVAMAYESFGVWSLVAQSLCGSLLLLLFNWFYVRWWPSLQFSIKAIKPMWAYGSRLFASGVLDTLYTRMDTFIIAKIFSPATLGFYSRAQGMDGMVRQFSAGSIVSALFPQIAKHQHDRQFLKELFLKYLHIIMFISVGMSGVLFLIARDLFTLLFTARWEFAAELFQIMAIGGFVYPVSLLMCNIISGVGNSKAFFRLELIKKGLLLPIYIFGFLLGLKGFLYCFLAVNLLAVLANGWFTAREVPVKTAHQMSIIFHYLCLGAVACVVCYVSGRELEGTAPIVRMAVQCIVFGVLYIGGAYLVRLSGTDLINISVQKIKTALQ